MGRKTTPVPQKRGVNIKNKRAEFDFLLFDKFTAGIVLTGTEIKSIRAGKASLVETYCIVNNGEVWVKNMYVAPYLAGSYNNHLERRERKLLLNKKELRNLQNDSALSPHSFLSMRTDWPSWTFI